MATHRVRASLTAKARRKTSLVHSPIVLAQCNDGSESMSPSTMRVLVTVAASHLLLRGADAQQTGSPAAAPTAAPRFELPCDGYLRALREKGNFGLLVTRKDSPFAGTHHLGEDVWLPGGTVVRSVAAGIVRYSDFSPSWKDERGRMHWNLGNAIVVEHPLDPPIDGMTAVCSFYVHLAAGREVKVGDRVERGQRLGTIGRDRSEENGRYPAHLHFGLHRGPYVQIHPSLQRELETTARTNGIRFGTEPPVRGEIDLELRAEDESVLVRERNGTAKVLLSLLVGSTAPGKKPADIMGWCSGYGDEETVGEWLRPSTWIPEHANPPATGR